MAETTQLMLTNQELVQLILQKQGIHEGIWSLAAEFKLAAAITGPSPDDLMPTALVAVSRLGIQQTNAPSSRAFDAAILNPQPKGPKAYKVKSLPPSIKASPAKRPKVTKASGK
jgi:hypothetical protein